jgi:hypothetical protein
LIVALKTLYPDVQWKQWSFARAKRGQWNSASIRDYIKHLEGKLSIKKWEDWYRISALDLKRVGAYRRIETLGGLYTVLPLNFPEFEWNKLALWRGAVKSEQRNLKVLVQELFPEHGNNDVVLSNSQNSSV